MASRSAAPRPIPISFLYLDRHFPAFAALLRRLGSRQIRNLGTLAGNLATASPIGDTLPCLVALGASVRLRSQSATRVLAVEDFITGYRATRLAADEIIERIGIPLMPPGSEFAAYKISKRFDQDISTLVAAFRLERDGDHVRSLHAVFGGMAARIQPPAALEGALAGRPWSAPAGDIDNSRRRRISGRSATTAAAPPTACAPPPASSGGFCSGDGQPDGAHPIGGVMTAPLAPHPRRRARLRPPRQRPRP